MRLIAASALLGLPLTAAAQPVRLDIDVTPRVDRLDGERLRVAYVVRNRSTSADSLLSFTVQSGVPVLAISRPEPASNFLVGTSEQRVHAASWTWLDRVLGPGEVSPPLTFEAAGLVGVVRFRAMRDVPMRLARPGEIDDDPRPLRADEAGDHSIVGWTVGVEARPANATPASLTARLATLVDRACQLGWVGDAGICTSLHVKVRADEGSIRAFAAELEAQRGKHVSEAAFALLHGNATYLLSQM